jgi:hypothetical protein
MLMRKSLVIQFICLESRFTVRMSNSGEYRAKFGNLMPLAPAHWDVRICDVGLAPLLADSRSGLVSTHGFRRQSGWTEAIVGCSQTVPPLPR